MQRYIQSLYKFSDIRECPCSLLREIRHFTSTLIRAKTPSHVAKDAAQVKTIIEMIVNLAAEHLQQQQQAKKRRSSSPISSSTIAKRNILEYIEGNIDVLLEVTYANLFNDASVRTSTPTNEREAERECEEQPSTPPTSNRGAQKGLQLVCETPKTAAMAAAAAGRKIDGNVLSFDDGPSPFTKTYDLLNKPQKSLFKECNGDGGEEEIAYFPEAGKYPLLYNESCNLFEASSSLGARRLQSESNSCEEPLNASMASERRSIDSRRSFRIHFDRSKVTPWEQQQRISQQKQQIDMMMERERAKFSHWDDIVAIKNRVDAIQERINRLKIAVDNHPVTTTRRKVMEVLRPEPGRHQRTLNACMASKMLEMRSRIVNIRAILRS